MCVSNCFSFPSLPFIESFIHSSRYSFKTHAWSASPILGFLLGIEEDPGEEAGAWSQELVLTCKRLNYEVMRLDLRQHFWQVRDQLP